ncbi:MAG: cupin domain-containing protein [Chloroflexi bacterium]|nr:cupin domain-containing protein [Chloroflexota bacterium]
MPQVIDETNERVEFRAEHLNSGIHFKNLKTFPVHFRPGRGSSSAHFSVADNQTIDAHISEIAPGGHNHMHRHVNEAIIYILTGRGYSLLQDGDNPPIRVDWEEGDVFSPPLNWFHQHFNLDPEKPARYLAVTNALLMTTMGVFKKEKRK